MWEAGGRGQGGGRPQDTTQSSCARRLGQWHSQTYRYFRNTLVKNRRNESLWHRGDVQGLSTREGRTSGGL